MANSSAPRSSGPNTDSPFTDWYPPGVPAVDQLIAWEHALENHAERVAEACAPLTEDQFNQQPQPGIWSCAEVIEHLNLSARPYCSKMEPLVLRAIKAPDQPIPHTYLGKQIAKMAGPSKDVPVPRGMTPQAKRYEKDRLLSEWTARQHQVAAWCQALHGSDLSGKFANPFIPILKLTLADGLLILCEHTERHVRQIEDRAKDVSSL